MAPYEVGFDFGYAHSLLALQRYDVDDLLSASFGPAAAKLLIDTYFVSQDAASNTQGGRGGEGNCSGAGGSSDAMPLALCCDDDATPRSLAPPAKESPFSIVLFARIGINPIGLLLLRLHQTAELMEVPLVTTAPEYQGHGITDALLAFAELLAAQCVLGEASKTLAVWYADGSESEQPEQVAVWQVASERRMPHLQSLRLRPPPHLPSSRLRILASCDAGQCGRLEVATAAVVSSIVAASSTATADAKAMARAREEAVRQADVDRAPILEPRASDDARQLLPNDPSLADIERMAGRKILLWGVEDAQFFYAQIESIETELPGGVSKTPTAAATRVAGSPYETFVHIKLFKYDEEAGGYVDDTAKLPLSGHELLQCPTTVWASDREAAIRCGFAIDIYGDAICVCRPWLDLAVIPSASSAVFQRQLTELATCCCSLLSDLVDWRPELASHFGERLIWQPDPVLLMNRVQKHIAVHQKLPPSKSIGPGRDAICSRSCWINTLYRCLLLDMSYCSVR